MDLILIYVTHSDQNNADKVNDHLFRQKLIASVSSWPTHTSYIRKGKIEKGREVITVYKTKPQNWLMVKEAIKSIHPDDAPCIVKIIGTVNHGHGNWILDSVI